jgi:hypothetical protein
MFDRNLSHELNQVSEQARSTAVALTAIGIEIQAVIQEERHDAGLASKVLDAHCKRAALAVSSLSSLVGQITLLARMGVGLVLFALCLAGCGSVDPADTMTPTCTATGNVWHFANAADKPGVPDTCTDLGGGSYECPATACLVVPYTGTCPACAGVTVGAPCVVTNEAPTMCRDASYSDVTRCDAPIENPGDCIGPNGLQGPRSNTWCCKPPAPVASCHLLAYSKTRETWLFSPQLDANPFPRACRDLGGGEYDCDNTACLTLPYAGTCPYCEGVGK